ncbi:hypothetical protein AVEN_3252-1 [Araneus ventricosus]|uniref:Uncharacterized protein n=1 Tax=Araneus ventricosus TaxID=182803 RepID=A0A4Y2FN53_ARAVE|nr:hypothetical protein AVEN_3252-1 [Araneus ventricosus]
MHPHTTRTIHNSEHPTHTLQQQQNHHAEQTVTSQRRLKFERTVVDKMKEVILCQTPSSQLKLFTSGPAYSTSPPLVDEPFEAAVNPSKT